jgi:hypothetical protein
MTSERHLAESVATVNGYVILRRLGSQTIHLADIRPESLILTKWIGPEYWALHWDAVALCGAVLKPDHRGLVAMREGTKVTCRHCRRRLQIAGGGA